LSPGNVEAHDASVNDASTGPQNKANDGTIETGLSTQSWMNILMVVGGVICLLLLAIGALVATGHGNMFLRKKDRGGHKMDVPALALEMTDRGEATDGGNSPGSGGAFDENGHKKARDGVSVGSDIQYDQLAFNPLRTKAAAIELTDAANIQGGGMSNPLHNAKRRQKRRVSMEEAVRDRSRSNAARHRARAKTMTKKKQFGQRMSYGSLEDDIDLEHGSLHSNPMHPDYIAEPSSNNLATMGAPKVMALAVPLELALASSKKVKVANLKLLGRGKKQKAPKGATPSNAKERHRFPRQASKLMSLDLSALNLTGLEPDEGIRHSNPMHSGKHVSEPGSAKAIKNSSGVGGGISVGGGAPIAGALDSKKIKVASLKLMGRGKNKGNKVAGNSSKRPRTFPRKSERLQSLDLSALNLTGLGPDEGVRHSNPMHPGKHHVAEPGSAKTIKSSSSSGGVGQGIGGGVSAPKAGAVAAPAFAALDSKKVKVASLKLMGRGKNKGNKVAGNSPKKPHKFPRKSERLQSLDLSELNF
jgi:hypothetical protein